MSTTVDTPLAQTLVYGERSERPCPHEGCDGSLNEDEDGVLAVCPVCNHSPSGTYVPYPSEQQWDDEGDEQVKRGIWPPNGNAVDAQHAARRLLAHPDSTIYPEQREYDDYHSSGRTKMYGGHERAYPHEKTTRDGKLISGR